METKDNTIREHNSGDRVLPRAGVAVWPPPWLRDRGATERPAVERPIAATAEEPAAKQSAPRKLRRWDSDPSNVEVTAWEECERIESCQRCGALLCWWDGLDHRRCLRCDPPTTALRLLRTARRIRRRYGLAEPIESATMCAGLAAVSAERFDEVSPLDCPRARNTPIR
jgi:hypothetical protein